MSALPAPYRLGAPAQYKRWRKGQDELLGQALDSKKRFVALVLPTGSGKSLMNVCAHLLTGYRAAILTSTRALQAQYAEGFPGTLSDVKGASNYICDYDAFHPPDNRLGLGRAPRSRTCDDAPCHNGIPCKGRSAGCQYFDAVRAAKASEAPNTNYQYWMAAHAYSDGLGRVELLALDEAHNAPDELSRFLRIEINAAAVHRAGGSIERFGKMAAWARWAAALKKKLAVPDDEAVRKGATAPSKELRELNKQLTALAAIEGDWIVDNYRSSGPAFEPVWPAPYAERMLFRGARKVLLTSATLRPKHMELLGVKPEDYELIEAASTFPIDKRRVMIVPGIKVTNRSSYAELRQWVEAIDCIIDDRTDRKGILHTVSYDRAAFLMQHSRHRALMVTHRRDNTAQCVAMFKATRRPCILVSPSMTTGYDFPHDECRYQIITKIAFPDSRDPFMKARSKRDKLYGFFLAMTDLVQAAGRGNRAVDDWCETFIVDENARWFCWHYSRFAPKSFVESVEYRRGPAAVPKPPKMKLRKSA